MKTIPLPKFTMDRITALLRTRPEEIRGVLKAFGWRFHGAHGWVADLYIGGHTRLAILDMRTLSWRVGAEGRRDTWRGWLSESFRWCTRARGIPDSRQYEEVAHIIQCITGPWPELQAACDEQGHHEVVPNGTPRQASSRMDGEHSRVNECSDNQQVQNCTPPPTVNNDHLNQSTKPSVHGISRGCSVSNQFVSNLRAERVSTVDAQAEDGVITVITLGSNVTSFLRPWRGPRGDGGAA